jgi:hypothetical protein
MMNVKTLWHGGEPKRGISPMLGLLFVKSWELWDCKLKWKVSLALQVFTPIYIILGWAQRILRCSLASTRIRLKYARVEGSLSMQKFMEMKETLMDKNEKVIASLGLLEVDEGQNKV